MRTKSGAGGEDAVRALPQPPHVAVLVRVEAVGVIAAVLDVIEPAAVNGGGGVSRPGAEESIHLRPVSAEVAAALRAHCASAAPAGAAAVAAAAAGEPRRKSRSALCVRRLKRGSPHPPPNSLTHSTHTRTPGVHRRSASRGAVVEARLWRCQRFFP